MLSQYAPAALPPAERPGELDSVERVRASIAQRICVLRDEWQALRASADQAELCADRDRIAARRAAEEIGVLEHLQAWLDRNDDAAG